MVEIRHDINVTHETCQQDRSHAFIVYYEIRIKLQMFHHPRDWHQHDAPPSGTERSGDVHTYKQSWEVSSHQSQLHQDGKTTSRWVKSVSMTIYDDTNTRRRNEVPQGDHRMLRGDKDLPKLMKPGQTRSQIKTLGKGGTWSLVDWSLSWDIISRT